jgi:hypothetical protein
MKTYRLALEMIGAAISIEITDGHGAWALGKETAFSHRVNTPDADSDLTIDEKNDQVGPKISLQSQDINTNVTTVVFLNVKTFQENSCY